MYFPNALFGGVEMFEIFDENKQKYPIKAWLKEKDDIDSVCLEQSINLSNIPFAFRWIALMPDTHQGYGMPIGGVLALKDHVIPNAVGVDIGCGISYIESNLNLKDLDDKIKDRIIAKIMKRVPVGFNHRKEPIFDNEILNFIKKSEYDYEKIHVLYEEIEKAFFQLGTLGSGNHFIEIQKDEDEKIAIMVHSGSRNFGLKIANYFNDKAKYYCKKHDCHGLMKKQLSFLSVNSESGRSYIEWMKLAMLIARRNRAIILDIVKDILEEEFEDIEFFNQINIHHNYASLENHYGEEVWVHRKGAIKLEKNELGIIPGAMGSYSYIVKGLANPESFSSCSHGAGRHLSRKVASKKFVKSEVIRDLNENGVKIGIPNTSVIGDESRFAYKNIDIVLENQKDLCSPYKRLSTVLVIKG